MASTARVCVSCHKPLTLYIEPEQDEESHTTASSALANTGYYIDDDVQLTCGCHFHWQCLLDAYSLNTCPNCGRHITQLTPNGEEHLLCNLKNEGGLQEGLDILPIVAEEIYLKAYPEERRCRAFLEFCGEGDVEAVVGLLNDDDGDEEDEDEDDKMEGEGSGHLEGKKGIDVLRYQDQIGSNGTGLHVAIQNNRVEIAWLLLLLASSLDMAEFPVEVLQAAEGLGISREDQTDKVDIRAIRNAEDITPEQRAMATGGVWNEWVRDGRLKESE